MVSFKMDKKHLNIPNKPSVIVMNFICQEKTLKWAVSDAANSQN